jgi:hypothetical protein
LPFHSAGRPFISSFIMRSEASNSPIGTGCRPTTRREESPRPIPMTMRPLEICWSVAYELAVTVGSRMPGFVTQWPSLIFFVRSAASASSG